MGSFYVEKKCILLHSGLMIKGATNFVLSWFLFSLLHFLFGRFLIQFLISIFTKIVSNLTSANTIIRKYEQIIHIKISRNSKTHCTIYYNYIELTSYRKLWVSTISMTVLYQIFFSFSYSRTKVYLWTLRVSVHQHRHKVMAFQDDFNCLSKT